MEIGPEQPWTLPEEGGPPPAPEPPRGWSYWDLLVVLGFSIGAQLLVYVGAVLLTLAFYHGGAVRPEEMFTRVWIVLPMQAAWWALVFWVIYRVVRARDPRPFWEAIGWVRPAHPPGVYLSAGVLLSVSVATLAWLLPKPTKHMPIEELFRNPTSAFLLAGFGVLVAPVIEELLFRGFLYPVFERAHGGPVAVAATAGLFSLVHAPQYGGAWQNLLLLAYVGVVFGTIRAVSRSLIPSTLVHGAYNFTLFVGLYVASNRFQNFNF